MAKKGRPSLGKKIKRMTITFEDESLECLEKVKALRKPEDIQLSDAQIVRESLSHYAKHYQEKDTLIGVDELKFFQSYINLVGPTSVLELLRNLHKAKANTL